MTAADVLELVDGVCSTKQLAAAERSGSSRWSFQYCQDYMSGVDGACSSRSWQCQTELAVAEVVDSGR